MACYPLMLSFGEQLGRQSGQQPKSNYLAPKVLALSAQGRRYRLVGQSVTAIMKCN